MSIRERVSEVVQRGELVHLQPTRAVVRRHVFLYAPLYKRMQRAFAPGNDGDEDAYRLGEMASMLGNFISGGKVSFAMNPHRKEKSAQIAKNAPVELGMVDFRCIAPKPGMRLVGGFIEANCFVGLNCYPREYMDREGFRSCVVETRNVWDRVIGSNHPPLKSETLAEYIKENVQSC